MMRVIRLAFLIAARLISPVEATLAQNVPGSGADNDWHVTVYPVLAWVPLDIGIDVDIPPIDTDGGGSGQILDSRFDGAFFGGVAASNGPWRIEGYGLWAGVGGDRPERPFLTVDLDLIYGSGKLGRRVAPDLYVTGGVRRLALDYAITLGSPPLFTQARRVGSDYRDRVASRAAEGGVDLQHPVPEGHRFGGEQRSHREAHRAWSDSGVPVVFVTGYETCMI
jgi:hypothetical protein